MMEEDSLIKDIKDSRHPDLYKGSINDLIALLFKDFSGSMFSSVYDRNHRKPRKKKGDDSLLPSFLEKNAKWVLLRLDNIFVVPDKKETYYECGKGYFSITYMTTSYKLRGYLYKDEESCLSDAVRYSLMDIVVKDIDDIYSER